jgi:predicted ribosomally synthesized peptide with SipW-like signal peptide
MNRILLSVGTLVFVGALALGATGAFFSDSETSSGNTLAAGAIDLGIDNESYYNGVFNEGTSWKLSFDLDKCRENPDQQDDDPNDDFLPCYFFDFDDLKPGDYGEDTISIHVNNNESWLCADVTLTKNDDNTCTEPENDADAEDGACQEPNDDDADGDLAQELNFLWWADDGDNVLEEGERLLPGGPLGAIEVGSTATVPLADSTFNIWTGGQNDPVPAMEEDDILYIGKAWCFGPISPAPDDQDGVGDAKSPAGDNNENNEAGEPEDGGYTCDGSEVGNEAQTDVAMLDVTFRAVQARNNDDFVCRIPDFLPAVI